MLFIKKNGINCPSCSGKLENKIETEEEEFQTIVIETELIERESTK